ncbi:MAG: hypothetical protein LBT49_05440 [Prevotellaceae bacterium]|jgi:hypothetical protein|nr:hypothetical protein [Prevotellaceae bacterium]
MAVKKEFILTDDLKKNVFNVPERYFESLQDRIAERMSAGEPQPQLSWIQALRPQLAFAASFVALAVAGYGGVVLLNNLNAGEDATTVSTSLDDFYTSTLETYRLDEQSVLRVIDEEKVDPSVNTEDIIDYLSSTHVSLADIASLE